MISVLLRSDVILDINWSSPQIVYDIFFSYMICGDDQFMSDITSDLNRTSFDFYGGYGFDLR